MVVVFSDFVSNHKTMRETDDLTDAQWEQIKD